MSTLSDEYIKNFSKERKAIFNKRFSDDYDPNMSERSNIIRILNEMRELGLADGGRIGLKEGLGSFETNDPGEAIKEIINRMINVEGATFPISENISLNLGPDLNQAELGGIIKILGGELNLGIGQKGDEKAIGLSFSKEFNKGGRVGFRIGSDEGKDVSGREYGTTSAASMGVATSPSRDDSDDTFTNGRNNNNPVVDIGKAIATNTAKTYAKNKAIEKLGLGGIMSMSPQVMAILGILKTLRDPQIEDEDIKFAKGGRVAYQDGTPDRKPYETPVTDAIKSVNEKTQDLIMQGKDALDRFSGIDEVYDFPGVKSSAVGAPSDFRHQAASNLLAEALGKGKAGPIGYLSGGIGSFGLGTIREIGDFVAGVLDKNTTTKEAFDQALEDTISNFKGAFAPAGTTTEDLYAELMKDYQPIRTGMFDPFGMDRDLLRSQQIFAQRKKALEDARKKQKDFIEQEAIKTPPKKPKRTTTTKPGTGGGGGGFTPTTTAQNVARTASRVDSSGNVKAYGLARGGLAAMLGE